MTSTILAKAVGIGAGITLAAVGAFKAGRAAASEPASQPAHPTISAPALTSADISELRTDIKDLRQELATFNGRLSKLEGFSEAEREARRAR
jgi:TolA-binding protein